MKRFLFLSALASVALAGCVNDEAMEVTSKASDQKITFNAPVVSGLTRAVAGEQPVTDDENGNKLVYSTDENFRVYAQWDKDGGFESWITSNNDNRAIYMSDIEVAYDNSVNGWSSDAVEGGSVYYWPKTGALTFAAYSPSDVSNFVHSYSEAGLSVTDFTVKAATADQYDFMYSSRSKNRTASTGGTSYSGVDINFKHALSSIKFKVAKAAEYTGTTIRVKQVTILNAYSQGDFAESKSATEASWTGHALPVDYAVKNNVDNQELTTTTAVPLEGANDVILLPQAFNHESEVVSIKVDYSIQNGNGPELAQTKTLPLVVTEGDENRYYTDKDGNGISEWKMGKRYIYTITIGLEKIYFSPEVAEWVDVTVTPDLTI
ncbi:MAG: fimbrillin family protein [Bacteroidaceae bacterium]|nr:fimbrillin family protein [Bacteroidaceae bacterium]